MGKERGRIREKREIQNGIERKREREVNEGEKEKYRV